MSPHKLCTCCLAVYAPYKITTHGTDELDGEPLVNPAGGDVENLPVRNIATGEVVPMQGLCSFCNPKSTLCYRPDLECHAQKQKTTLV